MNETAEEKDRRECLVNNNREASLSSLSASAIKEEATEEPTDELAAAAEAVAVSDPVVPAINPRDYDQWKKDTFEEVAEEDIERYMHACKLMIPVDQMSFIDGVVLVSILSKIGAVDLYNDDHLYIRLGCKYCYEARCCTIVVTSNHWLIRLDILNIRGAFGDPYDVPSGITRLDRLEHLTVCGFRSLPMELSTMPRLQIFHLHQFSDLLENNNNFPVFPVQMELKQSKVLELDECELEPSSSFLAWMVGNNNLPMLEKLEFIDMEEDAIDCVLDTLRTANNTDFQDNLKVLKMPWFYLNNNSRLEKIFWFDVLSRFPKAFFS